MPASAADGLSISGRIVGEVSGTVALRLDEITPDGDTLIYRTTVVTDESGRFVLEGLESGFYQLMPIQAGYMFVPSSMRLFMRPADAENLVFQRTVADEYMDAETLRRLDSIPDSRLPEDEVMLPNGRSLADYLNETMPDGRTRREHYEETSHYGNAR